MPGPGTELRNILSYFVKDDGQCGCKDHAKLMDKWGPDGCELNRETILKWLQRSAKKRGLPFSKIVANLAITLAIKRARDNG